MAEVRTAHTAALSEAELRAVRGLLDEAFDGDFTDQTSSTASAACTP